MSGRNVASFLSQTSSYNADRDSDYTEESFSSETTYDSNSQSTVSNPPLDDDSSSSINTRIKSSTQVIRPRRILSSGSSDSHDLYDSSYDSLNSDSTFSSGFYDESDYELSNLKDYKHESLSEEDIILTSESSQVSQVSSHSSDIVVKYGDNYSTASDEISDYTSASESATLTGSSLDEISQSTGSSFDPSTESSPVLSQSSNLSSSSTGLESSSETRSSVSSKTSLSSSGTLMSPALKRKFPETTTQGRVLRSGKKLLIKRH